MKQEVKRENPKVEIQIDRHKQLFDTLKNPRMMWRVLLSLFFVIVVLFIGLAFVVLSVKSFYPYNAIQTNIYGATIMKNEDKELIYWLFNSADVWANSGIEVHKGDELTIRSSGASFTAIHHLVDNAKDNTVLGDMWVDTDGQNRTGKRDLLRAKYRLNPFCDEGKLLMQVLDASNKHDRQDWINTVSDDVLDNSMAEIIGRERRNMIITKDGILHFVVNDIVLTNSKIERMYSEFLDSLIQMNGGKGGELKTTIMQLVSSINVNNPNVSEAAIKELMRLNSHFKGIDSIARTRGLSLGDYYQHKKYFPLINELVYYKKTGFRDAWYADNVGSFLIVIERKK